MKNRRLLVALAVSVGLNLFLGGFVAARWWRAPHHGPGPDPFHVAHALHDAPKVRQLMKERMGSLRPERQQLRQARQKVRAALEAEPYDRARLEHALTELQRHSEQTQRGLHSALLDIADSLSPDERRALAKHNWRKRKGRPDKMDRPDQPNNP